MYHYTFVGQLPVKTLSGLAIASDFTRIVYGERGAYVEFASKQMVKKALRISTTPHWYYKEFRTVDSTNAKVYFQRYVVSYADYKVGMYYVSPSLLSDFIRRGKYRVIEA